MKAHLVETKVWGSLAGFKSRIVINLLFVEFSLLGVS